MTLQKKDAFLTDLIRGISDGSQRPIESDILTIRSNVERLRGYLAGRMMYVDATPLAIAFKQAEMDWDSTARRIQANSITKAELDDRGAKVNWCDKAAFLPY